MITLGQHTLVAKVNIDQQPINRSGPKWTRFDFLLFCSGGGDVAIAD